MNQVAPIIFDRPVYQRTGVARQQDSPVNLTPSIFEAESYGLLLYWKHSTMPYLKLELLSGDTPVPNGQKAVENLVTELELPRDIIDSTRSYDQKIAIRLQSDHGILRANVEIDTNHPRFCIDSDAQNLASAAKGIPEEKRAVGFQIPGYLLTPKNNEKVFVQVKVKPATKVPDYGGYVGLDLGNFNSTLVCLDLNRPDQLRLLSQFDIGGGRAALGDDAKSIGSVVHLRSIADGKLDDTLDSVGWDIGDRAQQALVRSMDGIELAAKRQIASPGYNLTKSYRVYDRHRGRDAQLINVDVPQRLAGELLACRMMELFRQADETNVKQLAISYPSTYSEREILQLREIVHRAWLRVSGRQQTPQTLQVLRRPFAGPTHLAKDKEGVTLMLDEASAAAFFFLNERIINAPGQLSRFRYLYPKGLNLLLYDCGGGTTDIALVRAMVRPENPRKLVLTVRGRVGRRNFGGDFITESVFRLLKAKAASMLASSADLPPLPTGNKVTRQVLEGYLTRYWDVIDGIIPTRFRRGDSSTEGRKRLRRSMNLWDLAEKIKLLVVSNAQGRVTIEDTEWERIEIPGVDEERRGQLANLSIAASEVDQLIEGRLDESIKICNALIYQKLVAKENTGIQEEHGEAEEVHWVVGAGAACRYPLIPKLLKERLRVPFINSSDAEFSSSRLTIDNANLKSAVAKGLVRVHYAKDHQIGLHVSFDSELSQRLPFEVVYRDAEGLRRVLYRENAHIDSMGEPRDLFPSREQPPPVELEGVPGQGVTLFRRFPGETGDTPFLYFRFQQAEGIDGRLTVKYDMTAIDIGTGRSAFVMTNEDSFEIGDALDLTPDETYLHPVQRGDL